MKNGIKKVDKRDHFTYWVVTLQSGAVTYRKKIKRFDGRVTTVTGSSLPELRKSVREAQQEGVPLPKNGEMLFAEATERYMKSYLAKGQPFNTIKGTETGLNVYLLPTFGHLKLNEITPLLVDDAVNGWAERGDGGRRALGIMRSIFRYCIRMGLADANPADNIEPPKRKKGRAYRTKFLSDADIGQLVDALGKLETDYNSERFRVLILLGLNTGLRVAEALALTWDDVDFKKKKLAVTKKLVADGTIEDFTKSKEDRFVPLGAFIQGALKTWKAEQAEQAVRFGLQKTCPFENLTDSALMQSHNTRIRLMRFVKSNDLPYFTYHDLRHTYGSLLAANGIEFTEIQRRLGHKDLGTTLSRYIHARQEPDAKAEEILDQIFCRMPR